MNEKITKPVGLMIYGKNEDGSYAAASYVLVFGDPKPMPWLSDVKEVCGVNPIAGVDLAASLNANGEACVSLSTSLNKWFEKAFGKDPLRRIRRAEEELENFVSLYAMGVSSDRRKLKRYCRRYARAVMDYRRIFYGGNK